MYREVLRKQSKNGAQTQTIILIDKPNLPKIPQPEYSAPRPLTSEEQAIENRRAAKEYLSFTVSATVFLDKKEAPLTELRWREGEKEYIAYSNVDFRYLDQLIEFETEKYIVSWFPFVGSCEKGDLPDGEWEKIHRKVKFQHKFAEYAVDITEAEMKKHESIFAPLDAVHDYYDLNSKSLRLNYLRREEAEKKRQAELDSNPPKIPDTVIHFWPVKS